MEPDIALAVGRTLLSTLSPFHELGGKKLRGVWYVRSDSILTEMILDFGPVSLLVTAVADDDTIDFSCANTNDLSTEGREDASEIDCWREFVGAPLGWGWITVNQQGYCDGLLLGFGGIEPNVLLYVMASGIKLRQLNAKL